MAVEFVLYLSHDISDENLGYVCVYLYLSHDISDENLGYVCVLVFLPDDKTLVIFHYS